MADFCKKCSIAVWGEDTKDLAGLITAEQSAEGLKVAVICEGCGPIFVDHNGCKVEPVRSCDDQSR